MGNKTTLLPPGTILRDIYRVDKHISSGGFGNTYRATNTMFNETVAIKEFFMAEISMHDKHNHVVVPLENNKELFAAQMNKFMKEAQRIRRLDNPHIVKVLDIFSTNNTVYYVMEFIKGKSLGTIIGRRGYPMHEDEVMKLLPQMLDALQTVHQAGLLHLDIKPDNLMLGDDGMLRLIDFGASKQNLAQGGATNVSAVSYTERYAPIEQMSQNTDKFGPATDFYALGATMLHLLTNEIPPYPSDIMCDKSPDKRESIQIPTTVSDTMRWLILWMMEVNQVDRPQCVSDIQHFLANGKLPFNQFGIANGMNKKASAKPANVMTLEQGGTLHEGKYEILSLHNTFGNMLVYTGMQTLLRRKVVIVELFPCKICNRDSNGQVICNIDYANEFDKINALFKKQISEWITSEHDATVYDQFEENGTTYCILSDFPSNFPYHNAALPETTNRVAQRATVISSYSRPQIGKPQKGEKWFDKKRLFIISAVAIIALISVFIFNPFGPSYSKEQEVDLGLSVNWSGYNLGTTEPTKTGHYYSWGEIKPKNDYSEYTYKYGDDLKCTYIGDDISGTEYDAASMTWGGKWRMPTLEEMRELLEKCEWKWTESNNTEGFIVKGPNGHSIFLPFAGYMQTFENSDFCYYWTSTYNKNDKRTINAWNLKMEYEGTPTVDHIYQRRYVGRLIRPVKDK